MNSDEAIKVANEIVLAQLGRPLSDLERHLIEGACSGRSYEQMADGWSSKTLKDAGFRLWAHFSVALGGNVKVSKSNFLAALIQISQNSLSRDSSSRGKQPMLLDQPMREHNPFGDRGRITNLQKFFDREEILRQIFEQLSQGCSQSLVGESQVGKSSLLHMICLKGPELLPSYNFISLDMQCIRDEDDFFMALCQELSLESVCRGFELFRKLRDKKYVLCIDEIERMTEPNDFSGRARTELRGLAEGSSTPLTLVIASRSPLSELFPDSPEKTSPLAGICQQIILRPFPPNIARAFIEHRLANSAVTFTPAQIEQLIQKSNGHPARLQESAAELYRQLRG